MQVGKVDESGQVVKRFLVHGYKVRLCFLGSEEEEEQGKPRVRLGLLPDFPGSEVSGPCTKWKIDRWKAQQSKKDQFGSIMNREYCHHSSKSKTKL